MQRTMEELEAGLDHIRQSPTDGGTLELIVCRPDVDQRVVLDQAELDLHKGLIGDSWHMRESNSTEDGSPHPDAQLNIMNARAVALIAGEKENWPPAGDQLYIDLDLSGKNLPPGTRFSLGTAIIEVTAEPHTGCKKFTQRFGLDAMKFVNSEIGRQLNLRGINAKVVQMGVVSVGDVAVKV